ncbi:MAG: PEP-CTERM sorting domain-containing protein [Phycisphaerales bacterium]
MKKSVSGLVLGAAAVMGVTASQASAGLIITGLIDGGLSGGLPKVIELYATTDIPDLSVYGAGSANNGGGTDGVELILSGSASAGDFIYLASESVQFSTYFGFTPTLFFTGGANGGPASINGDDAVELFYDPTGAFAGGETVVDVFGEIASLPGAWNYLDGWAYRNDNTGPDGSTFVIGNWTFSGINVTDGTTSNSQVNPPFPIGTYVPEPASLALMGLGGLAVFRRR